MKTWLLLLCLLLPWRAGAADDAPFTLHELAAGVVAAIDRDGRAGANAGFVIGPEAVAVIDSLFREDAARALLAAIRARTALPIRWLVNTHHHIDHVAGNALFMEAGATLVAHRHAAAWMREENLRLMGARLTPELRARIEALPLPAQVYDYTLSLPLGGGRALQLRHWPGHTGGDTVVSVSDAPVRFMGDLLWRAAIPNLVDARTPDWRATLQALRQDGQRYVPGHGGVASAQDLLDFETYLSDLAQAVREAQDDGERALALLAPRYAAWAYFKGLAAANVRDMQAEQQGRKRVPARPAP